MTTIFLVRHGQSEWNVARRITGQRDPSLSERGIQQSRFLAEVLRTEELAAIYTSTLRRTRETAQATAEAHNLPIQQFDALREIHGGILQGRYRDHRDPDARRMWEAWQHDKAQFRIPGGETHAELADRVIPCLREIVAQVADGRGLIVGHRNINQVILGTLLQWPTHKWLEFQPRAKFLYRITFNGEPSIESIALLGAAAGKRYPGIKA